MNCLTRQTRGFASIGALIVVLFALFAWEQCLKAATLYVALADNIPVTPYSSWESAATNIQDAVAAAAPGDDVKVGPGIYNTGSLTGDTRLWVDKAVTIIGMSGPKMTIIEGYQVPETTNGSGAVRCVYLGVGATLSGFTLRGGATVADGWASGGGAYCESSSVITNCIVSGNSAHAFGGGVAGGLIRNSIIEGNVVGLTGSFLAFGGGAYASWLDQCTLRGNVARWGGGAMDSFLTNCVIYKNAAQNAGGLNACVADSCTIVSNSAASMVGGHWMITEKPGSRNCIVYYNSAPSFPNCGGVPEYISYSCTEGLTGQNNISEEPLFVDLVGGNFRLRENSPCIGAGDPSTETVTRDRDNRLRNSTRPTDMGAYGYFGATMGEFIGWLELSGLPTDGGADASDVDLDGATTYQEWRSGTDPNDAGDVLKLLPPQFTSAGLRVSWKSVVGKAYTISKVRISNSGEVSVEALIETTIHATETVTSRTIPIDHNSPGGVYRVDVE